MRFIDLLYQPFGRLRAMQYVGNSRWRCVCECGCERVADAYHLRSGLVQSCGCFRREQLAIYNVAVSRAAAAATPDRFMVSFKKHDGPDGCWVWTRHFFDDGYGKFKGPGPDHKTLQAHRYAYELFVGPIPEGMLVCHKCDNPPCVRPDHLFIGTHIDNIKDCIAKGRRWHQRRSA